MILRKSYVKKRRHFSTSHFSILGFVVVVDVDAAAWSTRDPVADCFSRRLLEQKAVSDVDCPHDDCSRRDCFNSTSMSPKHGPNISRVTYDTVFPKSEKIKAQRINARLFKRVGAAPWTPSLL